MIIICRHINPRLRISDGRCKLCVAAEAQRAYRERNPRVYTDADRAEDRKYRSKLRKQLKREIVDLFGGQCVCCGERELAFLCFDHINGGGGKHRQEVGASYRFYYWLLRQVQQRGVSILRKEFRVLCANCNTAFAFLGFCPHHPRKKNAR